MKKIKLSSSFISNINIVGRGGFVTNQDTGEKYFISHVFLKGALDRDTVKISLIETRQNRTKAKVDRILRRNKNIFIAKVFAKKSHLAASLYPFQSKPITIKENKVKANIGDIVKIKIFDWRENHKTAYAKVTSLISAENDVNTDFLFISGRYELNSLHEVGLKKVNYAFYESILKNDQEHRVDLTNIETITIDPDKAGDFDDAVSVVKKKYGYNLFIHIADVSAFVKEGDPVDIAAREKANSYYFPEKNFHMLPEFLSTDICSLKSNRNRLALTLKIKMNENCSVIKYSFFESIVKSNKRFTYSEASSIIKKLSTSPFAGSLNILNKITKILKNKRLKNNGLNLDHHKDFYSPSFNDSSTSHMKKETGKSHRIIEECMLIANKIAAKKLINMYKNSFRIGLFRNHDIPTQKSENYIKDLISKFSKVESVSKNLSAKSINSFLKKIDDSNSRNVLSLLLIRKMKKAFYSSKNIGHYGLGFDEYTHFTSPIRRYSDLIVHRMLKKQIKNYNNIPESVDLCNRGEIRSKMAHRDYIKLKGLRWLKSQKEKNLQGIIINLKTSHISICETSTETMGYIDINTLPRDLYVLASNKMALFGKNSKKRYDIGNVLNVKIDKVDMINQDVKFKIV